jgi:hypothetical protein
MRSLTSLRWRSKHAFKTHRRRPRAAPLSRANAIASTSPSACAVSSSFCSIQSKVRSRPKICVAPSHLLGGSLGALTWKTSWMCCLRIFASASKYCREVQSPAALLGRQQIIASFLQGLILASVSRDEVEVKACNRFDQGLVHQMEFVPVEVYSSDAPWHGKKQVEKVLHAHDNIDGEPNVDESQCELATRTSSSRLPHVLAPDYLPPVCTTIPLLRKSFSG